MNVYVCEALTANLGLGAISSLVYSYYYYYYICKALRANPRLGAILSLRYYYYYYYYFEYTLILIIYQLFGIQLTCKDIKNILQY